MDQLETLKLKYLGVINYCKQSGVRLKNVHIENGKLLIRGDAPTQEVKNDVWNQIKLIDAAYPDLVADISIDPSLKPPAKTHTVVSGDTLWKIAEHYYGKGNGGQYKKIVAANDIKDENKIHPGEVFIIPD
ncbi:MAG: LysM peptidoglycan-binding domain-containing protein [Bryobacteraceae bacterium]